MDGLRLEDYMDIVKAGPAQYYSQTGLIEKSGAIIRHFGKKALISGGKRSLAAIENRLLPSLDKEGIQYQINVFTGECSENNVTKLIDIASKMDVDFIIGVGGGKSLDTAKIAAEILGKPIINIPTIAGTCAASTPMCVMYSDEGVYIKDYYLKINPNVVLVDFDVLLKAPIEYFRSGILDSIAKWYEGKEAFAKATATDTFDYMAISLAKNLRENMLNMIDSAISAVKNRVLNDEFKNLVNLNIFTAGSIQALGVKAVRNGLAHAVQNGLTALKEGHQLLHGIKVGYGIAVQMFVQNSNEEELEKLFDFYKTMGLIPTFKALNLPFTNENVEVVAKRIKIDPLLQRPPFNYVTVQMLIDAMNKLEKYME